MAEKISRSEKWALRDHVRKYVPGKRQEQKQIAPKLKIIFPISPRLFTGYS